MGVAAGLVAAVAAAVVVSTAMPAAGVTTPPPAPTGLAFTPASPGATTTPRLSGDAAAGSTVQVYENPTCAGTPVGALPAADFASPGYEVFVGDNLNKDFTVTATDPSGSTSACSASISYHADVSPPAPPSALESDPPSPGSSTTPSLSGSAEAGSTVSVYPNPACTGPPTASLSAGEFASPGVTVAVADGTQQEFTFSATDAVGNTSACSLPLSYVADVTPPVAPTGLVALPSTPSTSTTPVLHGSAEAGSTVRFYADAGCVGDVLGSGAAADLGGAGVAVSVPADAATVIRATATDPAGNVSSCSSESVSYVNDSTAPAAPTGLVVSPGPTGASTVPAVLGTAESGSTVTLHAGSCSGPSVASGSAAWFAAPGLAAPVAPGSTTVFTATATDAAGNTSPCSAPVTYTQRVPAPTPLVPDTSLTATPAKKLVTTRARAKVSFAFTSTVAGATFVCTLDGRSTVCSSGQGFKVGPGRHTFAVAATLAGASDPTPATFDFKVRRKRRS